jgi:glycosyltransferase involved in cell wall biosynthesis
MVEPEVMSDEILFKETVGTIAILTGSHLCHNPRVIKEATALAEAGYDVCVLGAWFIPTLKARDQKLLSTLPFRFHPVVDSTVSAWRRFDIRARRKVGLIAHQILKMENRWQLGYGYDALRQAAFDCNADLYLAHSESAMAVGADLLRNGRRVGVDMEDWFSEDLLPEARRHRPLSLLQNLERELLSLGAYQSCPSHSMSEALARAYRCAPPGVICNSFHWSERKSIDDLILDRKNRLIPSIHWFSQTLGPGRGLETLFAALPLVVHQAEIHLRGNVRGFEQWLWNLVPESWRDRIFIHDVVSNQKLLSRIAEHDIGFAGEMTYCRNRDLTITNKILQYFLAGLAVVASDTEGQREVATKAPDSVLLYPSNHAESLAESLNGLLGSTERLRRAKVGALRAANEVFSWECQEEKLLLMVAEALSKRPAYA